MQQDTEFPGVVARPIGTFKTSSDYHYQTMRCNVDLLKLIQIGITLADEEGNFPQDVTTWQFNFKFNIGCVRHGCVLYEAADFFFFFSCQRGHVRARLDRAVAKVGDRFSEARGDGYPAQRFCRVVYHLWSRPHSRRKVDLVSQVRVLAPRVSPGSITTVSRVGARRSSSPCLFPLTVAMISVTWSNC